MLYLIIETFHHRDAVPVYRRFREHGRMMPSGVRYVSSWVTQDLTQCYQVMECDTLEPLSEWMSHWKDLVDFTVVPVITSAEAAERVVTQSP